MTAATTSPLSDVSRKVLQLQIITLIWMSVEAIVSLGTAWTSHSPALLAFGGDSLIELLSAAVVFWRFRFTLAEARAARIAGGLLFALARFVVLTSVLNFFGYREAQRSLLGIGILFAAAVMMPCLASRKRKVGSRNVQCSFEGRCCGICPLWLHGVDCPCGTCSERHLESTVG